MVPSNPHKSGSDAANTFRADEILAVEELFRVFDRGGDIREARFILRSAAMLNVRRKFAAMQRSIERQRGAA